MPDNQSVDELSLEELETLLQARCRVEHARRLRDNDPVHRFRPITVMLNDRRASAKPVPTHCRERMLFILEIGAVIELGAIIVGSLVNLDALNQDVAQARKSAAVDPSQNPIAPIELPGSSFPPADTQAPELPGLSFPPADEVPPRPA